MSSVRTTPPPSAKTSIEDMVISHMPMILLLTTPPATPTDTPDSTPDSTDPQASPRTAV